MNTRIESEWISELARSNCFNMKHPAQFYANLITGKTYRPPSAQGLSWLNIADKLGAGGGSVRRAALASAKTRQKCRFAND
jgi:hypothetical protein